MLVLGAVAAILTAICVFLWRRLLRARAEAASLRASQAAFLTLMNHEFRTPLNGVIGIAESLTSELPLPQRELAETMASCGRELLTLISDVTDYAELNAGRLKLESERFELRECIRSAVRVHRRRAWSKAVELRVSVDHDLPVYVEGDAKRLEQVVNSLLGNAVKFTESGYVELRVAPYLSGLVRFDVEDTGVGIPAAELRRIFEPFAQVDTSPTRPYSGVGVGLAVARGLVRLMGGEIRVASVPGTGSKFWFEAALKSCCGAHSGVDAPPGSPLRILVVEDNAVNQRVAMAMLNKLGHRVDTARNGLEAVEKWTAGGYDLVLMDCQMPVMDGYEATQQIRLREGARKRTPIVALTAHSFTADREKCMACGMDDYLTKPVHLEELEAALARHRPRAIA